MITLYGYIVEQKCSSDDDIAKHYATLFPLSTNREDAWRRFIHTVGKTREHWNKLGYVSRKIRVTVNFTKQDTQ